MKRFSGTVFVHGAFVTFADVDDGEDPYMILKEVGYSELNHVKGLDDVDITSIEDIQEVQS